MSSGRAVVAAIVLPTLSITWAHSLIVLAVALGVRLAATLAVVAAIILSALSNALAHSRIALRVALRVRLAVTLAVAVRYSLQVHWARPESQLGTDYDTKQSAPLASLITLGALALPANFARLFRAGGVE
jgi:hypothetical protein